MTPDQQFILALIAAVVPLIAAIGALFVQVRSLKLHVNSRMDQLLAITAAASKAQGRLEGPERSPDA